jgi:TPP-dependent pyruvate/acetoin dehydrogenase alpha subunit
LIIHRSGDQFLSNGRLADWARWRINQVEAEVATQVFFAVGVAFAPKKKARR